MASPLTTTLTPSQLGRLGDAAFAVAHNAYAPFSHFRVGAALLLSQPASDTIVTGCNVENASFRLTTCAEQSAVAVAVAQHGPGIRILAVAVANLNGQPSQPCGACRQTLLEFSLLETLILYPGANGQPEQRLLSDLLPNSFALDHA